MNIITVSKQVKQNRQREINQSTNIVRDFNTPFVITDYVDKKSVRMQNKINSSDLVDT